MDENTTPETFHMQVRIYFNGQTFQTRVATVTEETIDAFNEADDEGNQTLADVDGQTVVHASGGMTMIETDSPAGLLYVPSAVSALHLVTVEEPEEIDVKSIDDFS